MSTALPTLSPTESEQTASIVARWIERAALILTLSLTVCRTTILEFIRDPFAVTPGTDAVPAGPGPTTSLVLNALLLIAPALVLLAWAIDRRSRLRGKAVTILSLILASIVIAGAFRADDRFPATIDAANLIAGLATMWTIAQLTRSWKRLRLIAAVAVGVLMIGLAHSGIDHWIELPARQENFRQNLPEMLKTMHIEPGTFEAERIVTKVSNGELLGFGASINTFAAVLVVCMLIAGGAAFQRWRDGDDAAVSVTLALLIALAGGVIVWTACRAAYATPIMGAGIVLAYGLFGATMNAHRRLLVIGAIVAFAGVITFIVHHGLATGTLFHDSLNFRWRYWLGAFGVWREHPFLGVGFDSFGAHYLAHRLPVASEEIKDPHNFLVRAFAELGLLGGIVTLVWIGTLLERLTRPARLVADLGGPTVEAAPHIARSGRSVDRSIESDLSRSAPRLGYARRKDEELPAVTLAHLGGVAALASIFLIGMLAAFLAGIDFARPDWNLSIAAIERTLFFCTGTLAAALVALRSLRNPILDDRPAPWIRAAMTAGVFVFVVHNLIDFAVFESSAMFIAAVVAGAAWGAGLKRQDRVMESASNPIADNAPLADHAGPTPRTVRRATPTALRFAVTLLAALAWLGGSFALIGPTAIAESAASDGDDAMHHSNFPAALHHFEDALAVWPSNGDYALRAATAYAYTGNPDRSIALRLLDRAIAASPMSIKYRLSRARYGEQAGVAPAAVLADFETALSLDPAAVDVRLEYADALARLNKPADARTQYERALAFNDELTWDEPKRLSKASVADVRAKIDALPRQ